MRQRDLVFSTDQFVWALGSLCSLHRAPFDAVGLSVTADGVALTPQPGDGKAMRAGSLGFYVMPGGTLEITDARIRSQP